ncbi:MULTISPECIES: ATP-dependent DNA helicase RecQ [unclassified Rhizobacter]|uniref:RecQ family ATP-dependent DNA helicase n=1 Tax=unclassified Rhizobacter TaxID=2640088 RepID=UPI0009EBF908|nr:MULTISPECIES: RecQ family ATP-dependent DNA helicase [unclassified Rhizobacter]
MPRPRSKPGIASIQRALRQKFHLKRLRDGQQDVIDRVMRGLPTLAVLPTGAGKSLCYQLPAVVNGGLTVVVSPLIALMKDQCDGLAELGISAVQFHSGCSAAEVAAAEQALVADDPLILFTTPERLADADFRARLVARGVALLAIDEAHCISQWGHDFRPAFLQLGSLRGSLGGPPVLALTATATQGVIDDIAELFDIPRAGVIGTGVYRPNLHYRAEAIGRAEDKLSRLLALVRSSEGSGLVYVATVKAAQQVFDALQATGESVGLYHGRLAAGRRHEQQDAFMAGRVRVMVATNAFGLGVDKPDIRFVLHYQIPPGLDAYYQESGRAGRDGLPAECTLLFSDSDRSVQQFFLSGRYPQLQDFEAVLRLLRSRERPWDEAELDAALDAIERPRRKLDVALNMLRQHDLVDAAATVDTAALVEIAERYGGRAESDSAALEAMVAYAQSGRCRWQLLLAHFEPSAGHPRCGTCDNCVRLARHEAVQAEAQDDARPPRVERSAFALGQPVRTRRHGVGTVKAADALSVTIEFPNGAQRSFQPQFVAAVRRAERQGPARGAAGAAA